MDAGYVSILISVLTVGIVAYLFWKRGTQLDAGTLVATVEEAVPIAQTLAQVAEIGVQAAEQYASTGKIPRDERMTFALNYVKSWSPALASLENEKILAAIESAVLVANALSVQAQKLGSPKLP